MEMQVCNTCGEEKCLTEFPKNGVDKNGKPRRRPDCKVCYTVKRKIDKKGLNKFLNNTKHRTGEEQTLSLQDWKESMIHFGGTCAYCGTLQSRRVKLTKEHVVPVNLGGLTVRENIIPACTTCNCSKNNSKLDEWFVKQKFYTKERHEKIRMWCNGLK